MAKEWHYTIDIPPVATPRPNFRRTADGRSITYYPQNYIDYMDEVQSMLERDNAINKTFYDVLSCRAGVKAEIIFYVKAPQKQKKLKNLMRTAPPDIDNLLKAALDSIFKGLKVKDSRITMVSMAKFQEIERPRTEITLRGIE